MDRRWYITFAQFKKPTSLTGHCCFIYNNQDEKRDWVRNRRSRATAPSIVTLSQRAFLLSGQGPEGASEMDRIGYIQWGQSKPHPSAYQRGRGVQCHHQHVGCWAWEKCTHKAEEVISCTWGHIVIIMVSVHRSKLQAHHLILGKDHKVTTYGSTTKKLDWKSIPPSGS